MMMMMMLLMTMMMMMMMVCFVFVLLLSAVRVANEKGARQQGPHAAHAGDGLEGGDTRRPRDAPGGGGTKTNGQLRHGRFGELNNVADEHFGSQSMDSKSVTSSGSSGPNAVRSGACQSYSIVLV